MATSTLTDRTERTTAELAEAARAHLVEAEQHAARAAAAAARSAEHYGARAARAAEEYGSRAARNAAEAADRVGDQLEGTVAALRDDAEELWDDPETRRLALQAAGGVALVGFAVWLWRRRRRKDDDRYVADESSVAGWQEPREALDTADAG